MHTRSQTSARTRSTKDARRRCALDVSCLRPMLPICATHCKWPLVRDSIPANLWYSGGLGLTGGLADIDSLFDCLIGIHEGKVQDSILDKYDQVRREMWYKFIDPVSSDNLRRLNGQDPEKA